LYEAGAQGATVMPAPKNHMPVRKDRGALPHGQTPAIKTPIKDFPGLIRTAIARASSCDVGGLRELDPRERSLLVRVLRNVSARRPAEPVRIGNLTLAAALHTSDRTTRRVKASLEDKGWITRHQVKSRLRGMQVSDIWLTPHALLVLGLAPANPADSAPTDASPASARSAAFEPPEAESNGPGPQRRPDLSDALALPQPLSEGQRAAAQPRLLAEPSLEQEPAGDDACEAAATDRSRVQGGAGDEGAIGGVIEGAEAWEPEEQVFSDPSVDAPHGDLDGDETDGAVDNVGNGGSADACVAANAPQGDAAAVDAAPAVDGAGDPAASQAAKQAVPEDLALLAGLGISVPGIRKLMGLASRAGHRLGDIVRVAGHLIERAVKPFCYVAKLIRSPRNWKAEKEAGIASQTEAVAVAQARNDAAEVATAIDAAGMLSHGKRAFVWRVIAGTVHQSTVEDAARGGIGRWVPMLDLGGLARAWREGRLFKVGQEDLVSWAGT
jgi:hypothetical protein